MYIDKWFIIVHNQCTRIGVFNSFILVTAKYVKFQNIKIIKVGKCPFKSSVYNKSKACGPVTRSEQNKKYNG